MKRFNTTGTCFPQMHYMVDISERVEQIKGMVDQGDYFCINRGRQYGKTTTLQAIKVRLDSEYSVFNLSFESASDTMFSSIEKMCSYFLWQLNYAIEYGEVNKVCADAVKLLKEYTSNDFSPVEVPIFKSVVNRICSMNQYGLVLLIDEVDQAGNFPSFIKFLGILREMFLNRSKLLTFHSVILVGVYDIKNRKMRLEREHQYNSPWNIAVPFDINMSLHTDGIAGMLAEYKSDHRLDFDENFVAGMIYDYTHGYPFMVSRLCQIIDQKGYGWDYQGVLSSVHDILNEQNTLFDDMVKKMDDFPQLRKLLTSILYTGESQAVSLYEKYIQLGLQFCFLRDEGGTVKIANRITETFQYNLFAVEQRGNFITTHGSIDNSQFIHDGILDVRRLIERFVVIFNDIYSDKDESFVVRHGRQFFLLYLKQVINRIGNYYIEAETRNESRTDVVIDYLGHQYVIEMKIWRGNSYVERSYNERGEQQLAEYLEYFHLDIGYLVSFCFHHNKQPGIHEVAVGRKKVIEAVV